MKFLVTVSYILKYICIRQFLIVYNMVVFMQNGLATKVEKSRKQMKERKNRAKKIRGVKKVNDYSNPLFLLILLLQEL